MNSYNFSETMFLSTHQICSQNRCFSNMMQVHFQVEHVNWLAFSWTVNELLSTKNERETSSHIWHFLRGKQEKKKLNLSYSFRSALSSTSKSTWCLLTRKYLKVYLIIPYFTLHRFCAIVKTFEQLYWGNDADKFSIQMKIDSPNLSATMIIQTCKDRVGFKGKIVGVGNVCSTWQTLKGSTTTWTQLLRDALIIEKWRHQIKEWHSHHVCSVGA